MSFSLEIKEEITERVYKSNCCKKSILYGIFLPKSEISGDDIIISLESNLVASFASKLSSDVFGKELTEIKSKTGGRRKLYKVNSSGLIKLISNPPSKVFNPKCQLCRAAFLDGVILSSCKISDPKKQFLLEFTPRFNSNLIIDFFLSEGIPIKETERLGMPVLYTKNSSVIEDVFALAGLNAAAFSIMNEKINNEFRNNTNRVVNCETNNINKAVSASHKQINAIKALKEANLLSGLSEELEKTAILRLENEGLSLSQLAAIASPPISKPGLSHRLLKIIEYAEKVLPK